MKSSSKITQIPLKDIAAHNPECTTNIPIPDLNTIKDRWDFEKLYLAITKDGIQVPIALMQQRGKDKVKYEVMDGLQRLRVAEQLGHEKITAVIVDV